MNLVKLREPLIGSGQSFPKDETCHTGRRNGKMRASGYPEYERAACIKKVAYEPGISMWVELAPPGVNINRKMKFYIAHTEVGDANSSGDV